MELFSVKSGLLRGVADRHGDDDDHNTKGYCQSCLQYGIRSKLEKRMFSVELDKNEQSKPILVPASVPDADRFRQCYRCGDIVPIYNVKYVSKIEDFIETIDNPFDTNPGNMNGFTPGRDRLKLNRSKSIYKRKKQYAESIKDPDIKEEILKGNQVTIHDYQ